MSFEWHEIWNHMGYVARGVLLTLLLMSIWSAGVVVERLLRFASARRQSEGFGQVAAVLLAERQFPELLAQRESFSKSPLFAVVGAAIKEYHEGLINLRRGKRYDVVAAVERAVERTINFEVTRMRRGLGGLATISSSAPFVGLFGTTFGIINSFRSIGISGQGDLATVAPGIAEALVTTAFGIFVALPALWFFNHLMGKAEQFGADLLHAGSEVTDLLIKELGEAESPTHSPLQDESVAVQRRRAAA
jgi:biopolymer transport protein ExbB/TolQ